ncbi:MAG: ATP-binding cassette domain-containing protein, partial [Ruminococcus sp.]|nr:ATP-binding cassette domain-containing protein [Ruminococcus sp.]
EITVDTKRVGPDVDFPKDMGIIIETPGFIPYYSGYKNLKLLAGLNNIIGKNEVREAMQKVGLDPDLKRHVKKYSLGMRQRLGLAQAIMEDPKILILDEPFNGLDKDGVKEMREYLLSYKEQGKTIIIASHSSEDIDILCDTVSEMDKGILTALSGF